MEFNFNIENYIDCDISNLNLFTNYIYVLKLLDQRYYIGRTSNIFKRIEEHFTNNGSIYTKMYKPEKVIEIQEEKTNEDEKIKTLQYMDMYGWQKVRGSYWCSLEIKKPNLNLMKKKNKKDLFDNCQDDEEIKKMYLIENKNIIEIGEKLNRIPGSVAYRLEKLCLIDKRQLARGYYEYIISDLYNDIRSNKICRQNKKNDIYVTDANVLKLKGNIKSLINNDKNINIDAIKNKIKENFCDEKSNPI